MEQRNRIKKMVFAALLTALAIIIPIQFGFLKIIVGPFSATVASHVPMFIAMLISPLVAVVVGVGSGIGFLLSGMPLYVVARAFTHIIVGFIGAKIIVKNRNFKKATIYTAPIHGILEGLVVIPFGFSMYEVVVATAIGTILHHFLDGFISYSLAKSLGNARKKDMYTAFIDNRAA